MKKTLIVAEREFSRLLRRLWVPAALLSLALLCFVLSAGNGPMNAASAGLDRRSTSLSGLVLLISSLLGIVVAALSFSSDKVGGMAGLLRSFGLGRFGYLIGKYAGILASVTAAAGIVVLAGEGSGAGSESYPPRHIGSRGGGNLCRLGRLLRQRLPLQLVGGGRFPGLLVRDHVSLRGSRLGPLPRPSVHGSEACPRSIPRPRPGRGSSTRGRLPKQKGHCTGAGILLLAALLLEPSWNPGRVPSLSLPLGPASAFRRPRFEEGLTPCQSSSAPWA